MLTIPTKGFARSVNKHNIRLDILCDWIEASTLLLERDLSTSDVADVLMEAELYTSEDFSREIVMNAWNELVRRRYWIGDSCGFTIDGRSVRPVGKWQHIPAQVFCVVLSLAPYYDWWFKTFGSDYTEQGDLFELLTKASLEAQFNGWEIYQTGWTRTNTSGLVSIVNEVATRLGEELVHPELWDTANAKEMGLDLLCYRRFPDDRLGIPVYLMQCASGADWKPKLRTPDLNVWNDMICFRNNPQKAFASPFSFLDTEHTQNCVWVKGILLDRCRLLAAARYTETWVPESLGNRFISWLQPRIVTLLQRSQ
jgi:hypothetical protein